MPADAPVAVGTRVRVALHGRRVPGWVVAEDVAPPDGVVPQPVLRLSGLGPPPAVVALAEWAAWRWAGPVATFLRTASPERIVTALPPAPVLAAGWRPDPGPGDGPPAGYPRLDGTLDGAAEGLATPAPSPGEPPAPELLRLPPLADPLWLVLDVVAGARGMGSVLVLVPGTGAAERLAGRLARRGVPVALAGSEWAKAAAGWPVVVGSRAAAWAPVPALAAAVVLDAHDEAYREERAPTFDAVEVVVERARRERARCLVVSACPTAVQRAGVARRGGRLVAASRSFERAWWPVVSVVDRRSADPRTGLLSEELVRLADTVLGPRSAPVAAAGPLVCVLNRTGRARLLACRSCGELARCEHCGRPLELGEGVLTCRHCGLERPVVCAACGATAMKVLRPGIARLGPELESLLGRPVGEVAGPAAPVPPTAVLLGTEAVLHRVRRAAAVAFLDVDQHLLAPRFGAEEEALALVARAGRLVGARGQGGGPVLVQTRMPDHLVLAAAVHGDPERLAEQEAELRDALDLPPASALAALGGPGAEAFAAALASGPEPVATSALGDGRWLVRAPNHVQLCDALAQVPRPRERVRVEVDPTDV